MPRHNPETPLPDVTQEAYVQARAKGMGPSQAAEATRCTRYRLVERQAAFQARLRLLSGEAAGDPTLTLQFLVTELKRTVQGARSAGQFKNANEALAQLAELYDKHPSLRSDKQEQESGSSAAPATRQERRAAHRGRLAVVPEVASE